MKKVVVFSIILLCGHWGLAQTYYEVRMGKIDLRDWKVSERNVISLDGEWLFSWEKLQTWDEIKRSKTFVKFSTPWNEQEIEGKYYSPNGYATYAVEIILPPDLKEISLDVPAVFNSYALWANGQLVCTNGKVGASIEDSKPQWKPQSVLIKLDSNVVHLVMHITNFQNTRGGASQFIKLAAGDQLIVHRANDKQIVTLIFYFFLFAGVVGLIVYLVIRQINIFYFSMLAFALALRFIFSDIYLYYDLLPMNVSWPMAVRIEYMTIPLIIITGGLFMSGKYPNEFKKGFRVFYLAINSLFIALIVLIGSSFLSQLLSVIQVITISFLGYAIYAIINALLDERVGAWTSALGLFIFALVGIYNIVIFIFGIELSRLVIYSGYSVALLLSATSLFYRTPGQISTEKNQILRYSDFYTEQEQK